MKKVPAPIKSKFILICEKCGKKLAKSESSDENPARILQKSLKEKVKAECGKDEIRPVVSSCMNVCPDGEIAVAVVGLDAQKAQFFTIDLPTSGEAFDSFWSELKKTL